MSEVAVKSRSATLFKLKKYFYNKYENGFAGIAGHLSMKGEGMRMEQIIVFLTEYSSWISMGLACLMVILLSVTLHRIRQMQKEMREISENTRRVLSVQAEQTQEENKNIQKLEKREEGQFAMQERPEELIDAVLGEVFP